jgi:CheY-like chemotaxis protein
MIANPRVIILIDDNSDDNFFHGREIRKAFPDVRIITYTSASHALNQLETMIADKQELPSIILLDINMPLMNGWEFLEEIRKRDSDLLKIPIIIMHAPIAEEIEPIKDDLIAMVSGFIRKPITKEKILAIITNPDQGPIN